MRCWEGIQSAESCVCTLMQDEHIGDRSLFQFLWCLRALSDSPLEDSPLLWKLFLSWLSPHVQSILVCTLNANSMDHIAAMANKIIEFSAQPATKVTSSNSLATATSQQSCYLSPTDLLSKIDALTHQMNSLCQDKGFSHNSRGCS